MGASDSPYNKQWKRLHHWSLSKLQIFFSTSLPCTSFMVYKAHSHSKIFHFIYHSVNSKTVASSFSTEWLSLFLEVWLVRVLHKKNLNLQSWREMRFLFFSVQWCWLLLLIVGLESFWKSGRTISWTGEIFEKVEELFGQEYIHWQRTNISYNRL